MNFLGHLYFSNNDKDLMTANLFGDFCKGRSYKTYPTKIQEGVLLHRSIDSYIDNHKAVKKIRSLLHEPLPKVAGIAIDLYFDHLLAKQWSHFHNEEYNVFLDSFYQHQSTNENLYPESFQLFLKALRNLKWMNHYPTAYGLQKSCEGVSKRISFENELKNAPILMKAFETMLQNAFIDYMKDARAVFLPH